MLRAAEEMDESLPLVPHSDFLDERDLLHGHHGKYQLQGGWPGSTTLLCKNLGLERHVALGGTDNFTS